MTKALAFDPLVQALHGQLALLPDDRKGKNTNTRSKMLHWARLRVLTQSPSLLAYQRTMQQAKGRTTLTVSLG